MSWKLGEGRERKKKDAFQNKQLVKGGTRNEVGEVYSFLCFWPSSIHSPFSCKLSSILIPMPVFDPSKDDTVILGLGQVVLSETSQHYSLPLAHSSYKAQEFVLCGRDSTGSTCE